MTQGPREECSHCPPFDGPTLLATQSTIARLASRGLRSNPGYTLVTTRRHVAYLSGLDWSELVDLAWVTKRVAECLRSALGATKVTLRANWGPPGQHTPHVHLHLVPRFPSDGHDGYLPGPLEDVPLRELTELTDGFRGRILCESRALATHPGQPLAVDLHPLNDDTPGIRCASVVIPPDGTNQPGLNLASALHALCGAAADIFGMGRVTGLTIRLAAGPPEPLPTDDEIMAYPRWAEDGFATVPKELGLLSHSTVETRVSRSDRILAERRGGGSPSTKDGQFRIG
jgi:diadenosine tetraphosphate (Ap4A) HIT family hydrolase